MSNVQRVCPQCGQANPLEARYCARCGYDAQSALPAQQSNLPMVLGRAAAPILLGAASLAVRAAWKLLRSKWAQDAARRAAAAVVNDLTAPRVEPQSQEPSASAQPLATREPAVPVARRGRRTIRIRSAWSIGDANGVWRQGTSEQTIEIED